MAKQAGTSYFQINIFQDQEDFRIIFLSKTPFCDLSKLSKQKFSYGMKWKLLGNWFAWKEGGS